MALRFMQVVLPESSDERLEHLLEGREVIGTWRDATVERRTVIHLLVPAEETEPIMDRFEAAYGQAEGFRVVLIPVEAVLPRPPVAANGSNNDSQTEAEPNPETEPEPEPSGDAPDQKEDDVAAAVGEEVAAVETEASSAAEAFQDPGRVSREELYHDVSETLGLNRVFLAMTALSSIVAAVGLLRDDVAVIIGAMVIAPLLGPNVAMALATTLGDLDLLRRAIVTNVVGVSIALAVAVGLGLIVPLPSDVPAIAARTRLGFGDLVLALAAGSAGTFAFTRGMANAVIGVMVAVALMPPLVVFGLMLGSGRFDAATGAFMLVFANVVCINLAGVGTFLTQGVRPRSFWEEARQRRATRVALAIWIGLLLTLAAILAASGLRIMR